MSDDIKKLMQKHIQTTKSEKNKEVDSSYAKYNSRGQLMCIVCGTIVKSKIIWQAHIIKKSHKENLTKLLEKQKEISSLQFKANAKQAESRLHSNSEEPEPKRKKPSINKPKGILKNFGTYESSDEENSEEISNEIKPPCLPPVKSEVPSDFFDEGVKPSKTLEVILGNNEDAELSKAGSSLLPEGFFDDPVADAKARKVEYVDKEEEEWLSYMKEVSAAAMESRQIIAEDKEEAAVETRNEQVTEQIKYFERVVEMDKTKKYFDQDQEMKSEKDSGSDASSDEEFSTVIWRTKNSLI